VRLTAGGPGLARAGQKGTPTPEPQPLKILGRYSTDEKPSRYDDVTHYNNYYEFTTDKEGVADLAQNFHTTPWTVAVGGLVNKPKTFAIEDLLKQFPQEERIYRHRCVEGWSMVIPWTGFALAKLLKDVEPTAAARYVRFESVLRPEEMPGQRDGYYTWPYVEGLRLDEAMNDLACWSPASMASRPCRRTAPRCAWPCPGSTASRASSRSSRSTWWPSSRPACG
jgi:sulfoxide reductase catalytic subunit YedY